MRSGDVTFPDITLHDDPELLRWPVRPVIAIAGLQDVAVWDDPENLWDADVLTISPTARVGIARVGMAKVGSP